MKCPSCAAAELVHDTRDMPYTYKGESTIIPAVTGDFCPACDESILNVVESRRAMSCMLELATHLRRDKPARLNFGSTQKISSQDTPSSHAPAWEFIRQRSSVA